MSNVDLSIGSRRFTVACGAGEEAHVAALGHAIDARVAALGMAGQSETRMLLFAALTLADELHEQQQALDDQAHAAKGVDGEVADRLVRIAEALEKMASRLEAEVGEA